MRADLIVMPPPFFDADLRLDAVAKPLQAQALVPNFPLKDSSVAFSHGLAESMCAASIARRLASGGSPWR
jgi:hypothetical protein